MWLLSHLEYFIKQSLISSVVVIRVFADGVFELLDALGHADDLLLECSLLCLQVAQLLVQSNAFSAHRPIVPIDLLLHTVQLVSQGLARVLALHREHVLQRLFLTAQYLHLLLVRGQVLVQLAARFRQIGKLALEVRRVLRPLHLAHGCLT